MAPMLLNHAAMPAVVLHEPVKALSTQLAASRATHKRTKSDKGGTQRSKAKATKSRRR